MSSKLDDFNKILLATGAINYLSSSIYGVNENMKYLLNSDIPVDKTLKEGIDIRNTLLSDTVTKLYEVMEELGEYMNGYDCISPVDIRATNEAFKIVSGEHDNIEE